MEAIFDFTRAAAPWVTMGLMIAVLAVNYAVGRKEGQSSAGNYGFEGMCLGMCFGLALASISKIHPGIGISFGLFGLAIGMCIPKSPKDSKK